MRVNEFISETKVSRYDSEALELNKAMGLLNKYCMESLPLLPNPIWRGMSDHIEPIVYINPGSGIRKSTNTTNHYTELIDNSPYFKGWPKRSRSLICSSNREYAEDYGDYGELPYAIFPFDGVKIGVCPGQDIWGTKVKLPEFNNYTPFDLDDFNYFVQDQLKLLDNYLDMFMKTKTKEYAKFLASRWPKVKPNQVIPILQKALSPERTGFQLLTISQFAANPPTDKEVWMSGKVIAIKKPMWEKFLSAYKGKKK